MLSEPFHFLSSLGWREISELFWYTIIFDIPRYFLSALAAIHSPRYHRPEGAPRKTVAVILSGLNEAQGLGRCVAALHEQTCLPDEIIVVDDGSTDDMPKIANQLRADGLITAFLRLQDRGGKSSATNAGVQLARSEIVVVIDCDCTVDKHALERIITPLYDPEIVGVGGNVMVRNETVSFYTSIQAIEYMISISLGRTILEFMGILSIIPGAFGAFRRDVYLSVGGMNVGGGEDLEFAMRLRDNGYRITYVRDAILYTDVPETADALLRQRQRWEGDAIWLRFRRFGGQINPFSRRFNMVEAVHQFDFLFFHVIAAAIFPFYVYSILEHMGEVGIISLVSVSFYYIFSMYFLYFIACYSCGAGNIIRGIMFIPGYVAFYTLVMRPWVLIVYIREWFFSISLRDPYVPPKVQAWKDGR